MDRVKRFIKRVKRTFNESFVYHKSIPEERGSYEYPDNFKEELILFLEKIGIKRLYKHQKEAIDLIKNKNHVVIATPTASGKSLIYNLPVIEEILDDPASKALYIFPLKALEQDQFKILKEYNDVLKSLGYKGFTCAIFDGDTPISNRIKIKKAVPNILITNPEMIHLSILPYHWDWKRFLCNLKFIVIDEVHTYRGIFGSNMAWVFRRLIRICNFYGSYPVFIFCSATIGNPKELAQNLTGLEVLEVKRSYSPSGKRHFLFINPLFDSAARAVLMLIKIAISLKLRTIVYTQSRKMTELLGIWIDKSLPEFKDKIGVYRAGFLPEERRDIERKLRENELIGVISTSALELGIDIGSLDVCILVGYPGSIMAAWQRAGRVGRRQQESVVVMVAQQDSIDQYFMRNPEKFFELPPENAVINILNPAIMEKQILCAAADLPISIDENIFSFAKNTIDKLAREFKLMEEEKEKVFYPRYKRIHHKVNLRGTEKEFVLFDVDTYKPIGTIDAYRAYHEAHKGAVYLHNKGTFLVKEFSPKEGLIWVKREDVKYYTRVRCKKETKILCIKDRSVVGDVKVGFGEVEIMEKIVGFEKLWSSTLKKAQFIQFEEPIFLNFYTQSIWIELPLNLKKMIEKEKLHFMGGIHAVEHVLIGILPLVILADRNDLGGISMVYNEQIKGPAIFIYDGYEGGVGLAKETFKNIKRVIEYGVDVLFSCDCENGCPSCIQSPKCGSGNKPLDKKAAKRVLSYINNAFSNQRPVKMEKEESFIIKKSRSLPYFGVFDIETQYSAQEVGGWHRAQFMRLSYAVVYDSYEDKYFHFLEKDIESLFEKLQKFELVVGFNIINFDYKVLKGYKNLEFDKLSTLDILLEIYKKLNFRVSLNNLAKATLKVSKKGDGLDALRWWREGNIKKLGEYCEEDVRITKELFLFGWKNGYLLFSNKDKKLVKVYVDW